MNKGSVLVCFGYHVQSTRIGIDDRSRYNAEFRERGHAGAPLHRPWHCGDSCRRIDKTNLPKWLRVDAHIVVCIKRINAVMLCGHIDHVMRSAARYGNIRQVQRLPTTIPSTPCVNNFPKLFLLTLLGVSSVSLALTPVRALSLLYVSTLTCASAGPDRIKATMAIKAATPAKSRKESRTHQCAINSQTGYTRIQVLHFGNGTSLGAQPGLPGGRGRQSTSIRCPGQSNKYGVPGKTRNG